VCEALYQTGVHCDCYFASILASAGTLLEFCGHQNVKFCYLADMDQLSTEQQETLRKNSTDRLRVMAGQMGDVDDDEWEMMDRVALLELVAKSMMAKNGAV